MNTQRRRPSPLLMATALAWASIASPPGFGAAAAHEDDQEIAEIAAELRSGHPKQALTISAPLAKAHQQSAEIQALHGLALLDCGEFAKAQEQFELAIAIDPEAPDAHLGLGEVARGRSRWALASVHLHAALESEHQKLRAYLALGRSLSGENRHADAKAVLVRALDEVPALADEDQGTVEGEIEIAAALEGTTLFEVVATPESTSIAFENRRGHVLTPAKLNGEEVDALHLDLGSSGSLSISQALADKLDLRPLGTRSGRNVANVLTAEIALLERLQLGEMTVLNVPVAILPDAKFVGGAAGNLGNGVLRRMNLTLDYRESKLHLFQLGRGDLQDALMDSSAPPTRTPFLAIEQLIVMTRIGSRDDVPLILDSGAGACVFDTAYFQEAIQPHGASPASPDSKDPIPHVLEELEVGGIVFEDVFSVALDLSEFYEYAKVYYPGILGNNVLQGTRLHLSFADSSFVIEAD